jgi:hypothetical protein
MAAIAALPANSFLLDGEAIVTDAKGLAVFDLIRHKRHSGDAVLIAFDLMNEFFEGTATSSLNTPANSALKASCPSGWDHAIARGVPHWLKIKNPAAPAVKRDAEEEWSR